MKPSRDWLNSVKNDDIDLVKTIEKEKSKYVGHEIIGKTLGFIGLGQVGAKVACSLYNLGMNIVGYDAYLAPNQKEDLKQYVNIVDSANSYLKKQTIYHYIWQQLKKQLDLLIKIQLQK